jgi:RNA polymerase-associated protein LEO1
MSTSALFADTSSDEEDESPAVAPQEKTTTVEAPSSNDKDEDGAEAAKGSAENEESKEGELKSRLAIGDGDSDDDDGDAEFDDQGGIVGSSAPPSSQTKTSEAADDASGAIDTGDGVKTTRYSNKPPENATVLQTDRPNEDVSVHITKLPNLVAIQPAAFDEATYLDKEEESEYKGYVHNMIRWKYKYDESGEMLRDKAGNLVRESNSKLVKWDDGSYTLHIGTEVFNIQNINSTSNSFAGLNGYIYLSQKATFGNEEGEGREGPGGTVLECVGPVASRFIPKPSSLQSHAHKSLTVSVRQRTLQRAKIAEFVTQEDPEKLKQDRIKTNQEEDKIRARKKAAYRSNTSRHRMPGMNRRYMEDDDDDADYDTTNISAMKKGAMEDDMDDYGDDSDDGYDDTTFSKRNRKRERKASEEEDNDDEDEEELVFGNEDDDEDDVAMKAPNKKKRSHQAVLDDDDSD